MTGPVDVRADDVVLDARQQDLDVHGNVRIDADPFYLASDHLRLRRSPRGILVDGVGRVGFCHCLGTPLAIAFDGATLAPPGDLLLKSPTLMLFGVKILPAPFLWLRSPGRMGLLPPDIAWRATDGLFLGEGFHIPWVYNDNHNGIDVSAGGYIRGGAAVESTLRTPVSTTRIRWDYLDSTGLVVDARGANGAEPGASHMAATAWDVDLLRGARAVQSTTPLDTAARPYDRGSAEVAWRPGGFVFASAVRTVSERGGDLFDVGAGGPVLSARASGSMAGRFLYDATVDGGALSRPGGAATSFARGDAGLAWATRAGPVGVLTSARGSADVASDGQRRGAEGNATARATFTLPLARAYAADDPNSPNDPLVHRLEPRASVAAVVVRGDAVLGVAPGRGAASIHGEAVVAEGGFTSTFGHVGSRTASEYTASGGVVATRDDPSPQPALRNRAAFELGAAALAVDHAHVFAPRARNGGDAFAARVRLGTRDGLQLGALVTARNGADPVVARALLDATQEPGTGFLAESGWTGGLRVVVPWSRFVTTTAGADADVTDMENPTVLAARGGLELHDGCGCLVLRLNGAHRIGRPGVDVWLNLDIRPAL